MHPKISEIKKDYESGTMDRREFIRFAALLGLSLSGITSFLAGCAKESSVEATMTPVPATGQTGGPVRGGQLVMATDLKSLQGMDDPHTIAWSQDTVFRNVAEYLTVTNQDNVTVPWLLEKWEPSDDLKTWKLVLRQGIEFNTGKELTADDVVYNIKRWLDPEVGSSTAGLMGGYLSADNVTKTGPYTVELKLDSPQIAVPEHLYNYVNVVLPEGFEGGWEDNPVGTGPYTLDEFVPQEKAVLKRREGYWKNGADDQPLPYLDQLVFVAIEEPSALVAAIRTGEVDLLTVSSNMIGELEGANEVEIVSKISSGTHVIRMRADSPPFDDPRVRKAIKACQDRQQLVDAVTRGYGGEAEDHHVAPVHPSYCEMEIPKRDIEKAKALLAEAGHEEGIDISIATIDTEPFLSIAQLLKQQCEPAGIRIEIDSMPASLYWEQWLDVDFGITFWGHRPLAMMVLALAYRSGAEWNETHWSHERFDELLKEAEGTIDVDARREIMCEIQTIMKEEGPIALPTWSANMYAVRNKVKNFKPASQNQVLLEDVWVVEEA